MSDDNPSADPMVGKVVQDRYRITGILGQGGMGAVYRAEQTAMGREVAFKMLRSEFGQDEQLVERFQREARNSARLEHPNTVRVFDFGRTAEGDLFLVMELLSGQELADIIGDGLDPHPVIHMARQIARSVAEAHNKGLVHRDLKPANVAVVSVEGDDKFVKVLDFGLAKLTQKEEGDEKDQSLTSAGAALGTPLYMSPEQCAGVKVDSRCDIYALGCIIFEMLVGRPPFVGQSAVMTMTMHIRDDVPGLDEARPDKALPVQLEQIIHKCMAKDADDRYQKMEEVVEALEHAQQVISTAGVRGSLPTVAAVGSRPDELAMDMTVAPDSGVHLAQMVSSELSSPSGAGIGDSVANASGVSDPAMLPPGASISSQQSHVSGELSARSGIQQGVSGGGSGKIFAAIGVLALLGAGAFFFVTQGGEKPTPAQEAPKVEARAAAATPKKVETVFVKVVGKPSGAKVSFDDKEIGGLPALEKFPGGTARMKVSVSQKGYEPFMAVLNRDDAKDGQLEVQVDLKKIKKVRKKKKKSGSSAGYDDFDEEEGYEDF